MSEKFQQVLRQNVNSSIYNPVTTEQTSRAVEDNLIQTKVLSANEWRQDHFCQFPTSRMNFKTQRCVQISKARSNKMLTVLILQDIIA